MHRLQIALTTIGLTLGLSGCGGDGVVEDPRTLVPVKGKVVAGSEPIDGSSLSLTFTHQDGFNPTIVPIEADGTFSGEAAVGMNNVLVIAGGPGATEHVEPKSRKVHSSFTIEGQSSLQADVKEDPEANDFTFDVSGPTGGGGGAKGRGAHGG